MPLTGFNLPDSGVDVGVSSDLKLVFYYSDNNLIQAIT